MNQVRNQWTDVLARKDWLATTALVLIATMGMLFIYSAAYVFEDRPVVRYDRQIIWLAVGTVFYLGMTRLNYRMITNESWWLYGGTLALLALVLMAGVEIRGGKRWLNVFGVLFQPSEFAKVTLIIALAQYLSRPRVDLARWSTIFKTLVLTGVPMLLIVAEPDLGTALVMMPVCFVMMFVAGMSLRKLGILAGIGLAVVSLVLGAMFLPERMGVDRVAQEKIIKLTGLRPYHKERIEAFFSPEKDPLGASWTKIQSGIAIGSGGLAGKGFRKGTANILGFLPRTVAPTDFIFSVIAEESGFMGSVAILFLFTVLVGRILRAAVVADDDTGRLVCVGTAAMLFTHVFVNIAMTSGLLPITGVPLPLMSSGGSFLISVMIALGIVQSVFVRRREGRY